MQCLFNPAIFAMGLTLNIRFLIALLAFRPVHLHSMQTGSLVVVIIKTEDREMP